MSVLCVHVRRLCVPNIMSLGAYFKKLNLIKVGAFAWCSVKIHVFSVSSLKEEKLIKNKPTWKLKHANSILEYFEHFCQMMSKSILIISSYTASKLRRFFETQCSTHLQFHTLESHLHWHQYSLNITPEECTSAQPTKMKCTE